MATPFAFSTALPIEAPPSVNVTEPVAGLPLLVTVAVKASGVSYVAGLALEMSVTCVLALCTVCVSTALVVE